VDVDEEIQDQSQPKFGMIEEKKKEKKSWLPISLFLHKIIVRNF